jgi:hypothetical protein
MPTVTPTGDTSGQDQADATAISGEFGKTAVSQFTSAGIPAAAAGSLANQAMSAVYSSYIKWRQNGLPPAKAAEVARQEGQAAVNQSLKDNGADPAKVAPGSSPTVTNADTAKALDQYRQGINNGQSTLQTIIDPRDKGGMPVDDPNARGTFNPLTAKQTGTLFVADPQKLAAAQVAAPQATGTRLAQAAGAIATTDATAAPAINPALVSPAQRLQAATQAATNVQGTSLDTSQEQQSRDLTNQVLQDQLATSQGKGQAQVRSDAQQAADLAKSASVASGLAHTARGSERRGALLAAESGASEAGAQAVAQNAVTNAQTALTAQGQAAQTAQATRSSDLAVAAKRADLDAQRQTLQAQLDAARASGDAQRQQDIATKMADLDQQVAALNAGATNTAQEAGAGRATTVSLANSGAKNTAAEAAAGRSTDVSKTNAGAENTTAAQGADRALAAATTNALQTNQVNQNNVENRSKIALANQAADQSTQQFNSNQGVQVGSLNNQQKLAANVAGSQEDVAQAKLRMDAQKAIEDSAKGLLDENERQNQLAIARQQLAIAQAKQDQEAQKYWFDEISALVTTVGTVAKAVAPVAAVASDPRLKTNIKPIPEKDLKELAQALRDSASTWTYRTDKAADLPSGEHAGGMTDAIKATKLGRSLVTQRPDGYDQLDYGQMASLLAAHNLTEKKRRAV